MRILIQTGLMLLLPSVAFAQSASATDAAPGHGFIAVSPLSMTDDSERRLRGARLSDDSLWSVDAAVFFARNIAVGVEAMSLESVTRQQSYASFSSNDTEDERAVLVMPRARVFAKRRVALDVAFGGGIAYQHWTFHMVNRFPPVVVNDRIVDEKSPALGVGLDGPLSLVPHLALLPMVRLYLVNHTQTDSGGWSSRVALGIGAGVKW